MALPNTPAATPEPTAPKTPEPIQAQPGQAGETPQAGPKYVTEEQLEQVASRIIRDVKLADKQRSKQIRQEVETIKQTLQASGIQATPEQVEAIETKVAERYQDPDDEPTPQTPANDIPPEWQDALDLAFAAKVKIEENDPEYKQFLVPIFDNPNPKRAEITIAMSKAVEAKQARTLQQQDNAPLRTPTAGSGGPGQLVAASSKDYWRGAYKK